MKYNCTFSLKFSSELYEVNCSFIILVLFHCDSPQLSDYPCLYWYTKDYFREYRKPMWAFSEVVQVYFPSWKCSA